MFEIFKKLYSVSKAILTGDNVSDEVLQKRLEICSKCELVKLDGDNTYCGICGCKVSGDRSLVNLARYVETPDYGCKYPNGSKWKEVDL